jgi:hypothetical protein
MSDRPWLEDGDPSLRVERELLKRLNAQQPPNGSTEQGWAALAAEIPALQATGSSGTGPADPTPGISHAVKSGASLAIAAKIAVGVALTGGMLWTGRHLLKSHDTSSISNQPQPSQVPAETPPDTLPGEPEAVAGKTMDRQATRNQQPAGPASSATTLAEEGRLLAKAHQLVQSGQGQQALEVLRISASRYPRSVLYQEREVLTIEALAATGDTGAARSRAERFLKRHPNSPHAGRLQRFVE